MSKAKKNIRLNSIVIDSGPLLVALTVNYLSVRNIERKNSYLDEIWDKFSKKNISISLIQEYFLQIANFYISPHAIGELIGLAKSKFKNNYINQNDFWTVSIDYLIAKNINEKFIQVLELYNDEDCLPLIQEIGFIDTELIKLSKEISLPILTIDSRTLKAKALEQGVDVIVLDEDIYNMFTDNY